MKTKILIIILMTLTIVLEKTYSQENLKLIATMTGEKTGDIFSVVAGIGDVNGDGFDDLLVGAPGGNYAKLYFGGSPYDTLACLKLVPEKSFTYGQSIAGGGDLNGDGFVDFIIGAPQSSVFEPDYYSHAGKVFIYMGGSQVDTEPYMILKGAGWRYDFGRSVAFAGDVNKDGYDDIIIGAPMDDIDAHGRAYIYFGGADMDSIADVLVEGQEGFDMLGWSVSGAGDVNRDGFDDVIIGAPQMLGSNQHIGKAYLIYGGEDIGFVHSDVFLGDTTKHHYGRDATGLLDVNGDGFEDFGVMGGAYFVIISGKTLKIMNKISAQMDWAAFQYLSDGGDINKDGYFDLLISMENSQTQYSGKVAIYLGSTNPDTIPDYEITGQTPHYYFGCSVDFAGDINNDGCNEIIAGEQQYHLNRRQGKVYIYSYHYGNRVKEKKELNFPENFRLNQNYPNPFNSSTKISYYLYISCFVRLEIYNYSGQKIKTLVYEKQNFGDHYVLWNGKDNNDQIVSSGIYFVKMTVETFNVIKKQQVKTQKIILVK